MIDTGAIISSCDQYRYRLWRTWDPKRPAILFIGLNPSTADSSIDDPTVRRCVGYAKDWGYGKLLIGNLFAFRSTDPGNLARNNDPVGPENDLHLHIMGGEVEMVIAAWGAKGNYLNPKFFVF